MGQGLVTQDQVGSTQLSVPVNKDLRPQEVVKSLNIDMAKPRSNVGFICKTAEKGIMVRSLKRYFLQKKKGLKFQAKGIKLKG